MQQPRAIQPPAAEEKYAQVMFDYTAQQPDELNLTKGAKILVTRKDADGLVLVQVLVNDFV